LLGFEGGGAPEFVFEGLGLVDEAALGLKHHELAEVELLFAEPVHVPKDVFLPLEKGHLVIKVFLLLEVPIGTGEALGALQCRLPGDEAHAREQPIL
jgi:hypothetical protein